MLSPPVSPTLAQRHAADHLAANRRALAQTQPSLIVSDPPTDVEWVFGRDRAITARDAAAGGWISGCSLPGRAAAEMLRSLRVTGPVACFLAPSHGAQLEVALRRMEPEQALIAIVPDQHQLPILLSCVSVAEAIDAHRLWLVAGASYEIDLRKLFDEHPGLCTPSQFIRLPTAEERQIELLIGSAQRIFSEVGSARSLEIRSLQGAPESASQSICIVAPSRFRLWDDAGHALRRAMNDSSPACLDLDDPLQAGTLALARAASQCGGLVTANIARSDLPGVLAERFPIITWCGNGRIPAFPGAGPRDRLITASRHLARVAGWPAERIVEASWPLSSSPAKQCAGASDRWLALIVNTHRLDPPDDLIDYSSHRVLWELIQTDLHDNPFALDEDLDGFLCHRARRLDIAAEALPKQRFCLELMLPAYQQGLARLLIRAKLPVRLFGQGWDQISEFAPHAFGSVNDRETFHAAAAESAGLIHLWPRTDPHEIDTLGKPVLRRRGSQINSWLNDAKRMLAQSSPAAATFSQPLPLSSELIQRIIREAAAA